MLRQEEIFFDEKVKNAMKELWVRRKMKECKKKYSHPAYHNIFCGTWNINGKERLSADPNLSDWLLPENHSPQDIYVLGFQEIVPLTPMNIAVDPLGPTRTQYWLSEIRHCLQRVICRRYRLVGAKNLVGILLCVFVDESLYGEITDVRWTTTAVGVMGVMGNKGAVIVRFNLHGTSLCFVCAHLAAARENVQARNTDYRNIMERSSLLPEGSLDKRFPSFTRQSGQYGLLDDSSLCTILDHDLVFWIGDFNYRLDVSLSLEEIMSHICCENIASLRQKDQLTQERAQGNVFQGFEEAPLTFLPSYKFIAGSDTYDTRPERKLRPPAWCDRVLWKDQTLEGLGAVTPKAYRRSKLKTSDHKPVSAAFLLETRIVDSALERLEYERLLVEVGSLRSGTKPEVEIAPLEFHVPRIRYMERRYETCYLRNTGSSAASWRFIPKPNEGVLISEQWIHVEPMLGIIAPAETIRITLEIFVDYRSLDLLAPHCFDTETVPPDLPPLPPPLCSPEAFPPGEEEEEEEGEEELRKTLTAELESALTIPLNEILIVRIENGHDSFLTVSASFGPSSHDLATMRQQHANLSRLRADMSPSSPSHSHSQILPNEDDSDEGIETPFPRAWAAHKADQETCNPLSLSLREEGDDEDLPPESTPLARKPSRRHSVRISRTQLEGAVEAGNEAGLGLPMGSPGLLSSLSFRTDTSADEEVSLMSEDCWGAVTLEHKSDRIEL